MKPQEKKEANGEKQHSKKAITIAAPKEEWKDVESLISPIDNNVR
ncbi:hypothetical protein KSF_087560 [Reticulibacter mediterranei]|uniref:Uncharacterized protein n=1 Tax=Reticulibacter mediterranei TaxID=2778369 RepID=A0A8J3N7K7_9CHLR|nr:hypothetical protein [Reticulibacter mediterranei]GHO98708.1 hypothetical protein KSF_087560 [Reticulibacter mediterranei]